MQSWQTSAGNRSEDFLQTRLGERLHRLNLEVGPASPEWPDARALPSAVLRDAPNPSLLNCSPTGASQAEPLPEYT